MVLHGDQYVGDNVTVARRLSFNPYLGVGISGKIPDEDIPRILGKLDKSIELIEAKHEDARPD